MWKNSVSVLPLGIVFAAALHCLLLIQWRVASASRSAKQDDEQKVNGLNFFWVQDACESSLAPNC